MPEKLSWRAVARLAVVPLVAVAVLGSATDVFARKATIKGGTVSTRKAEGYKYVRVLKKSSKHVKGVYIRRAHPGKERNLWNQSAAGTTAKSAAGSKVLQQKICRHEFMAPDPCSKYVANP
ncbi:hypothetical protein ABZY93_21025 [Streptomyces smyrnaeus]|uniref:hypothetical protein n=1 Tax=Streptomyces smyrnaeus TaxID=1387713 RepID=UPI0033B9A780